MCKRIPWPHALSVIGLSPLLIQVGAQIPSRPATAAVPVSYTQEKPASLVDFKDKQVHEGYGALFRFYGRDCAQVPEAERAWRGRS